VVFPMGTRLGDASAARIVKSPVESAIGSSVFSL